jgi:YVTN family beta-propeller protein
MMGAMQTQTGEKWLAAGQKVELTMNAATENTRVMRFARSLVQTMVLSLLTWILGPTPAAAQDNGHLPPGPAIVYVGNGGGGVTEINTANNSVFATAPFPNNANGVVVTPDGRRMYATNRDVGQVTVFSTSTNVPLLVIPVGNGNDNLGLAVSPDGSVVYVANQFSGTVTVIATATNTVVRTIPTGVEPIWITFSADGSRAYVSNQVSGTISVIATASGSVITNIPGFACPFESKMTRDGTELLVSSQCDNSLKVVNLASNAVVNSIPTGPNPRGIALTPDGTRAYVADWFSNTVDVIDVSTQTNLATPVTVGLNPWGMAMTPGGKAYVANFGDNTISVIDTSTNTVTATLPSRGNPEDVTVSTTARPRILNYAFQPFDPPGSTDTVAIGVNNREQIVGRFQDGAGVVHGYLRQADGSFVTIDPPGSALTVAFDINDAGTVVGIYQASGGAFHGFSRSAAGSYTTEDFPGAVDSQFTGINSRGVRVGDYDLGNLSSSISFVEARGSFTSFEDPAAASMQTAALSINAGNFIAGLFDDASGNEHGFIRSPNAQFQNFDFPVGDFTDAYKINDLGQVVGQYATNFPNHGFILSGAMALTGAPSPCQFLSFDYPDSQASGARGINNLGQVAGFYRVRGNPARHGFLATRVTREDGDDKHQCLTTSDFPGKPGVGFASFDFPGSNDTEGTAITPSREIVGRYVSADGRQHGFILRRGQFTPVDVPSATSSTDVTWVNARGDIVGTFGDTHGSHAYVLSRGVYTTIDFPGSDPVNTATLGFGISNAGDVVGVEFVGGDFLHGHGYLFSHGRFTLVDVPGAVGTFPTMVLDDSLIVGTYFGTDSVFHGFLLSGGSVKTIDVPDSTFTWITGMNPEGDLVGFYNDREGHQHGFVLRDDKVISIDVPGATSSEGNGINPEGDVVGRYVTADGKTHGYFLKCVTCTRHDATHWPSSMK